MSIYYWILVIFFGKVVKVKENEFLWFWKGINFVLVFFVVCISFLEIRGNVFFILKKILLVNGG